MITSQNVYYINVVAMRQLNHDETRTYSNFVNEVVKDLQLLKHGAEMYIYVH